jgi:hypothetical protein
VHRHPTRRPNRRRPRHPTREVTVTDVNGHPLASFRHRVRQGTSRHQVRHAAGLVDSHPVTWGRDPRRQACAAHQPPCGCPELLSAHARHAAGNAPLVLRHGRPELWLAAVRSPSGIEAIPDVPAGRSIQPCCWKYRTEFDHTQHWRSSCGPRSRPCQ